MKTKSSPGHVRRIEQCKRTSKSKRFMNGVPNLFQICMFVLPHCECKRMYDDMKVNVDILLVCLTSL